jgi:hypothetical protein
VYHITVVHLDPECDELTALRLDDGGAYQTYAQGQIVTLDWPLSLQLDVPALGHRPA